MAGEGWCGDGKWHVHCAQLCCVLVKRPPWPKIRGLGETLWIDQGKANLQRLKTDGPSCPKRHPGTPTMSLPLEKTEMHHNHLQPTSTVCANCLLPYSHSIGESNLYTNCIFRLCGVLNKCKEYSPIKLSILGQNKAHAAFFLIWISHPSMSKETFAPKVRCTAQSATDQDNFEKRWPASGAYLNRFGGKTSDFLAVKPVNHNCNRYNVPEVTSQFLSLQKAGLWFCIFFLATHEQRPLIGLFYRKPHNQTNLATQERVQRSTK